MSKLSKILSVLSDGRWHMMTEIQDKAKLDEGRIQQVMDFLQRYCFVDIDKSARKVMLKKNSQKFLKSED